MTRNQTGRCRGWRSRSRGGSSCIGAWLEPHVDVEPERTTRRIGEKVFSPADGLAAIAADFRIHSRILGDRDQVAAGEAQPDEARTAPELVNPGIRQIHADRRFPQSPEGGV